MTSGNLDLVQEYIDYGGVFHIGNSSESQDVFRRLELAFDIRSGNLLYQIHEYFSRKKSNTFYLTRNSSLESIRNFERLFTSNVYHVIELEYIGEDGIFEFKSRQNSNSVSKAILDIWSTCSCSVLAVPSNPADHIIFMWYTGDVYYERRSS